MSAVQTTSPPAAPPVRQRSGSRAARILARPGWVILTLLSLFTVKFVAGYLTFDPGVYFPNSGSCTSSVSSCWACTWPAASSS